MKTGFEAREQNRYPEAERSFQAALKEAEKLGEFNPYLASSHMSLAGLYLDQRRIEEAYPHAVYAVSILESVFGRDHPNVALPLTRLAEVRIEQCEFLIAQANLQRALAIREKASRPGTNIWTAYNLSQLANVFLLRGAARRARSPANDAVRILEAAVEPEDPRLSYSLDTLARIYYSEGQYAEAEPLARRALAIKERALGGRAIGPRHLDLAPTLYILARLHRAQGRTADAEALLKRVLALKEEVLGPQHPDVSIALDRLAELYSHEGRRNEAESAATRSVAIRQQPGADLPCPEPY